MTHTYIPATTCRLEEDSDWLLEQSTYDLSRVCAALGGGRVVTLENSQREDGTLREVRRDFNSQMSK